MTDIDESEERKRYEIEISGNGLTFERQISEEKVVQILGILLGSGVDVGVSPSKTGSATAGQETYTADAGDTGPDGEPSQSIAEFMNDVGASNNYERLAAITLYNRDILEKDRVHREEFPSWFEKAGRSAPSNLPRDIKNAQGKGLIAESHGEDDCYYPTKKAEKRLSKSDE